MGERKDRLKRLIIDNPVCYRCGVNPSSEEDHVPPRTFFKDRIGPEGYGFASCAQCNRKDRHYEQSLAVIARSSGSGGVDESNFSNVINGTINNSPEYLPLPLQNARDARNVIKESGYVRPVGESLSQIPFIRAPKEIAEPMEMFNRKLLCALFYKHMLYPLPQNWHLTTNEIISLKIASLPDFVNISRSLRNVVLPNRHNCDIGKQFFYRWDSFTENSFIYIASIGDQMWFHGSASNDPNVINEYFTLHSEELLLLGSKPGI